MKILSLDIAAFGKFKNYHLDIPENLTVVFGENENGKSTIMAFIRMMFYGNTGKTSDIDKNPRIKYRPWDSDFMAGSISFNHNEKNYRIEREFKKSNSTDKITLIDLDTGVSSSLSGSDDIGAKFFGLTDAAFERSIFLTESFPASKNDAANGEINSRLSNTATTGNEEISFEQISTRLTKAKENLFSRGGKKGVCDKALAEKDAIVLEIRQAEENEKKLDELKQDIAEKEAEYNKHSAETAKLFEILKSADKIKKKAITEKYLEALKEKHSLENKLQLKDGNIADNDFTAVGRGYLANYNSSVARFSELSNKISGLQVEINKLSSAETPTADSFEAEKAKLSDKQRLIDDKIETTREKISVIKNKIESLTPVKKSNPLFFILGLVLLALGGVVCAVVEPIIGFGIIAVGIIVTLLGFIVKKTVAPDDSEFKTELSQLSVTLSSLVDEKESLNDEIGKLEKTNRDIQIKVLADIAILEEKQKELNGLFSEKEVLSVLTEENERLVLSHISLLTDEIDINGAEATLDLIDANLRELETANQRAKLLADHGSIDSEEQAIARLEAFKKSELPEGLSQEDVELAKERFKAHSDQNGRMRSEISALKVQLKASAEKAPSVSLLRLREEELSAQIEAYNSFGSKVDVALEVLDEAFREMRKSYWGALESRTAEIFSFLTDEKYAGVNISKNFELGVTSSEVFGLKDSQFLSTGTEDQLYLALRLALAELMTEQTGMLPLLMDDPLAQYDDKRMEQALEFLAKYSAERQVILFTCHNSIVASAKDKNANIITL